MRGIIFIIFFCMLFLASCEEKTDGKTGTPIDPPGQTATESGPSLLNLDFDTGYVRLDDIATNTMSEIRLDKEARDIYMIGATDEFYSYYNEQRDDGTLVPHIIRYDRAGSMVWERSYPAISVNPQGIAITALAAYPDARFVFAIGEKIAFFDPDGNMTASGDIPLSLSFDFMRLLVTENMDVVLVMLKDSFEADGSVGGNDIYFKTYTAKGEFIAERNLGGSDFEFLYDAQYTKDTGIIVKGATQSADGDFAGIAEGGGDFLIRVDFNTLEPLWSVFNKPNQHTELSPSAFHENFVYNAFYNVDTENDNKNTVYLQKINADDGSIVWSSIADPDNFRYNYTASLPDGGAVVCLEDMLVIFDSGGSVVKTLEGYEYHANLFAVMNDGSYVISALRNVKTVPQPVFVSSIWFDTATVVTRFDRDFKIIWRKTYDEHKDNTDMDYVYPRRDGTMLFSPR